MRPTHFGRGVLVLVTSFVSCASTALAQASVTTQSQIRDTGISGMWVLANVSYAGMRAQNNPNALWRVLAFLFGLPGTILTFFVVAEGSERAYGIDLPRRSRP